MARRPRVRWAASPDDLPGPGEYVAQLEPIPGLDTAERHPGRGTPAPSLLVSRSSGDVVGMTEPLPTDLSVRRLRLQLTVTAHDGRQARAFFDPRADAPFLENEAADRDLVAALRRAWRLPTDGRPRGSGRVLDWDMLVEAARVSVGAPTAESLSLDLDKGLRTVERVAAAGPRGDGKGGGMDAVRRAAGRQ